jgi:hypothetical protein
MDDETTFEDLADAPPEVTTHGRAVLVWVSPNSLAMTSTAARQLADCLLAAAERADEAL